MLRALLALSTAATALSVATPALSQGTRAPSCEGLTALRIPDVRIMRATSVKPDPVWLSPLPTPNDRHQVPVNKPLCRVEGMIEDEIGFELWLPEKGDWNQRMLGVGNGGFAGFIRYEGLARGVNNGFASVSTDTGHKITEIGWPIDKPRRLENYAFRGQHLTAVNAKKIIAAFYANPAHHHYFIGCSGGGMQAMNLAQRYPSDYDGIIAGSHGRSIIGISARWLSSGLIAQNTPTAHVTSADWRRIADAAITKCDRNDGVADGIINEPNKCRFDIAETPGLSRAQIATARSLNAPIQAHDGHVLFPGFQPGVAYTPQNSPGRAGEVFAQWYHNDLKWDFNSFDAARDLPLVENAVAGSSFTNPNLEAFMRRGGKLISQHGTTDQILPYEATVDYYDSVVRYLGQTKVDNFYKLYLPAGVDHCSGGAGPDNFGTLFHKEPAVLDARNDMLTAIVQWVEQGRAPDTFIASKQVEGQVTMTRPVCPYPLVVKYKGQGDTNQAENFQCTKP